MNPAVTETLDLQTIPAETAGPDGELLKWWHWKGRVHANERSGAAA